MFTSSQNQVNVLKAMKIRKFSHHRLRADLNKSYAKYFETAASAWSPWKLGRFIPIDPRCSSEMIYSFIKKKFLAHKGWTASTS